MIGTDTTELSSALQLCDKRFVVVSVTHRDYIKNLLSIVKAENVNLVVPTVDLDLKVLAENTENSQEPVVRCWFQTQRWLTSVRTKEKLTGFWPETVLIHPLLSAQRRHLKKGVSADLIL